MAGRDSKAGTALEPGFITRVAQGVRYAITGAGPAAPARQIAGVDGSNFFGPSQPIAPVAQEQAQGRAFDYPVAYNLRQQPRSGENISFEALRGLADGYDLMRLAIETRKDQVEAFDWEILPADKEAKPESVAGEAKAATEFLKRPDAENDWPQWLRMLIEELLVIDAVCVYPARTMGGALYGLELVDAATIKRLLNADGRTPVPPSPAYQQVLKGIPATDYTSDELEYMMRNKRVSRVYGMSPVETVVTTVNIALRRQMSQLEHYTSGNVPEALAQVPSGWTSKQIADFQLWWDSVMEGNTAERRKMRFVPSLDNIVFPKMGTLKDEMDEWLARIIAFAFSISPNALIKQVNRASGEQMADTAKEEGLMPLLRSLETFITRLLQKHGGFTGVRFAFKVVNRVNPLQQAQIHALYAKDKIMTPDEIRADLGKEALSDEQREAAWPAPPPMLPPPGQTGQKPPDAPDDKQPVKPPAEPTPAEKMLADALRMLDPQALAKAITAAAESQAPRIVEVRPEVEVTVGDTNVHVPMARNNKD